MTPITELFRPGLFQGRHVFVTGGGSGINLGVAHCFAQLGADISLIGRSQERLENASSALQRRGVRVFTQSADVRDPQAVADAIEGASAALGPVHVLICGAAGNFMCAAEALSPNGFRSVVDIDLMGSFHAAKAAFPGLRETRGSILFISAGQAFTPFLHQVHVGAAKAGVDNMMRNLALEWGAFGIRSNSIAPGFIGDTEGTRRMAAGGIADALLQATPLGQLGRVEDIGAMAVFLASPLAAYVTGQVVAVDGGHYLGGSSLFNHALRQQAAAA